MERKEGISRRGLLGAAAVAASCGIFCRNAVAAAPRGKGKEAGKPEFKIVAACGIYCGACEALVKSMRAKDPKDDTCHGCLSDKLSDYACNKCEIRKCALEKKVEVCVFCKSYPCDKLAKASDEQRENLKKIAEKGVAEFTKEQKARYVCKKCGGELFRKDKKCRRCGEPVPSEKPEK